MFVIGLFVIGMVSDMLMLIYGEELLCYVLVMMFIVLFVVLFLLFVVC